MDERVQLHHYRENEWRQECRNRPKGAEVWVYSSRLGNPTKSYDWSYCFGCRVYEFATSTASSRYLQHELYYWRAAGMPSALARPASRLLGKFRRS